MINLIDHYNQASWDLHYSLVRSGYENPTIALNDDGFLPDDVTSPYLYYTGFSEASGHALYFNQVPVPDFWEIRGDNTQAEIFNYDEKRGQIHYTEPKHQRLVKAVDWYDKKGRHRLTDRYNKFGYRYAQVTYNLDQQAILTSYFNQAGLEVIVENHQTGDILLNEGGQVHLFKNKTAFVTHYLRAAGFNLDRIFYNSLSVPFLVALYLNQPGQDILFWQEPIHDEVPGNMRLILKGEGRDTKIVVQDKATYERLLSLISPQEAEKVTYLGCLYPFKDHDLDYQQALIMTNSDQLEGVEELVTANPNIHFHIGALTEMSTKLTSLAQHAHVHLYPNISMSRARALFKTCGLYLDINHFGEILSATRVAFENQMVLLAFEQTAHSPHYVADSLLFSSGEIAELSKQLQVLATDPSAVQACLELQKTKAQLETTTRYQTIIG